MRASAGSRVTHLQRGSFVFSGALVLSCVMAIGGFGGIGSGFRGLQNAPPWAFLGGALGTTFVLGSIIAIPQAGSVIVICSGIVGQMIGSYLLHRIDQYRP